MGTADASQKAHDVCGHDRVDSREHVLDSVHGDIEGKFCEHLSKVLGRILACGIGSDFCSCVAGISF